MNLTWRSYIFATIIAVLGILGQWGPAGVAGLWRIPAAALIIILFLEYFQAKKHSLEISRLLPNVAHLGRAALVKISVGNTGTTPLVVNLLEIQPENIHEDNVPTSLRINPHTTQTVVFTVTPIDLRVLRWQKIYIGILGRYGFAWWSRKLMLEDQLRVVPDRLYTADLRRTLTQHQGNLTQKSLGPGHELLGLRDYHSGDPLHAIDWKATARSNRMIVRLFSEEQRLDLVILIDAGRASGIKAGILTRLGHYANIAARLAEKAIINGDTLGMVVFADDIKMASKQLKGHTGLQQARAMLNNLATIKQESNPLVAMMQVRKIVQHRSLVVVLTDLDDTDAASQLVKSVGLLRLKHLPLIACILDEETLTIKNRAVDNWIAPYHCLAAQETLSAWHRTKVKIEKLGVPVVMSTVDTIDARVLSQYDLLKARHKV